MYKYLIIYRFESRIKSADFPGFRLQYWLLIGVCLLGFSSLLVAQPKDLHNYDVVWTSQSQNSSESMPCGGGDIGLNVWVENNEILFYLSKSGTFDENNGFLKLGRVRLQLSPNPFERGDFSQTLQLEDGNILIKGSTETLNAQMEIWVDVFNPAINVDLETSQPTTLTASYESWRYRDRMIEGRANNANSFKWRGKNVITRKDSIGFEDESVIFFHHNEDSTIFDLTVAQQQLDPVKGQLWNPLKDLTFGGSMSGTGMKTSGTYHGVYMDTDFRGWKLVSEAPQNQHHIELVLHTKQTSDISSWKTELQSTISNIRITPKSDNKRITRAWWKEFWKRSYIKINRDQQDSVWQTGRNYQLFRYMLGCNAYGSSPTKFNGGLFTYDPVEVDTAMPFTPDHRNWGGGTHTAQNQRLVYFPMMRSGDFMMMEPQFDFYLNALDNAEWRSQHYWDHEGACFTEQLENFGLPNYAEYGSGRPEGYDPGLQYNAWLEYQWDTVLEFCLMILESEAYNNQDISEYIPLIESSLIFFDKHYQYLASQRGRKTLDSDGKLVLYPGSSCETYKMAYNATSTVAGLQVVTERLLQSKHLPEENREYWEAFIDRIPPLALTEFEGKATIAPAKLWERINNTEAPQLYPVYPWGIYGIGRPDLETAINTYKLDPDVQKFKSHIGWKQYNIWAARLGLTEEAAKYTTLKLKDSGRRFPAFWGPGFDWVPDHNWGGSGMIGLQEMILQTDGEKIYLFPAWPASWDVQFKLHAPGQTTVEGELRNGRLRDLKVTPTSRKKDVINLLD